ncbi:MAG: hypothetical protein BTN85_2212 [Candidatus Methanohalarchaeum thermophilum]|uniref:Uncharacterized protein n=1 Tax=Methanohalarchaeum thermophilum TaxID=1903181 RepID=A0A1Q6DRU0_METT1|nr:MAG: hypothetical protein BTN85_2212 [Candidatus Methanohalarchaeum thermophilum]
MNHTVILAIFMSLIIGLILPSKVDILNILFDKISYEMISSFNFGFFKETVYIIYYLGNAAITMLTSFLVIFPFLNFLELHSEFNLKKIDYQNSEREVENKEPSQ